MFEKLGVLSDIHANALALKAVLRDADGRGVRRFVNRGDLLYGPLQPLETYRILQSTNVIATVAGNQDRAIFNATPDDLRASKTLAFVNHSLGDDPILWLRSLPGTAVINDSVFLCHGTPASDTTYLLEDVISGNPHVRPARSIAELLGSVREPAILCGHSHIARMIQLPGGQLVLNPGSVGLPAYEDALPVNHFMETYAPHASYAVLEARSGSWIVSFHRVRYEWDEAAMRARELGREDWAQALAAGRMR